ncbi:hypothetical protein FQR65_LT12495 [Abscondita terminalis]|nr:hypothetical protein FQR65_LT12495 [Abscondita terminalis]
MEKPSVLILGGCGFIGRNLVSYLLSNNLVKCIRIVDKVPPQVAWLNSVHQDSFNNPLVQYKSANLINIDSCKNAFSQTTEVQCWDFAINCAGETKSAQTDPVYKEGILKLSLNCANEAALHKVKRYIEISSGQMFNADKIAHKEDDAVKPWNFIAKWKRQVETELEKIPNLRYTILRPALTYGLGDKSGLMPRLMVAAIYKQLGETMKLLWNGDLKLNTVHVADVCRAIWFVCNRDDTLGQIYNVVDDGDSTQGSICGLLADIFEIKVDYYGNIVSSAVDLSVAADDANDKHLKPWAEACRKDDVHNTPLSPHMDSEILLPKNLYLDPSKLKQLGFDVTFPKPTVDNLKEILRDYVEMKVFPHSLA